MKASSSKLLPLLRSDTQGEILALIILFPEIEWTIAELAAAAGVTPPTAMREVDRIAAAGLVHERRSGRNRLITADTETAAYPPLRDLMLVTYGPEPVLRSLLEQVHGVERAYIYGSWADRRTGHDGRVPGDIDVLVVGNAEADELDEAAETAERHLRREVSIRQVRPQRWDVDTDDSFVRTIMSRPLVTLMEPPDDKEQT